MRQTDGKQIIMPFGKHKGKDLDDVPATYLLWLYEEDWAFKFGDIMDYITRELDGLLDEAEESNILVED